MALGRLQAVVETQGPPEARLAVLLGHAMMTHRRSLDRPRGAGLASFLAARGWRVHLVDWPGHGEAGPRAHEGGDWNYDELVDAVGAVTRELAGGPGWAPLVILGHSLTSHLAINARGLDPTLPIAAIVAVSGGVWLPRWEPSAWYRWRKRLAIRAVQGFVGLCGRFPARRLGLGNEDEAAGYFRQLAGLVLKDEWRGLDGRRDYIEATARCDVPVLGVMAAGDRILSRPRSAACYFKHVGSASPTRSVETRLVRGADLGLDRDPDHMSILTDPTFRGAWEGIAEWVEKRFA